MMEELGLGGDGGERGQDVFNNALPHVSPAWLQIWSNNQNDFASLRFSKFELQDKFEMCAVIQMQAQKPVQD